MKKLTIFLIFVGVVLIAVVHGVIFLFDQQQKEDLYEVVPMSQGVVEYVSDLYDLDYELFDDENTSVETIRLYSPLYEMTGQVAGGESISIIVRHTTQGVLGELTPRIARNGSWTQQLSLAKHTLKEGTHEVTIVTKANGEELSRRGVRLDVAYDRIQIGETTMYLDAHHVPVGYDDDFLWETTTLEGDDRTFLTYGCDTASPQPQILIESYHQRQTIDACLSFSIPDQQLLMFEYQVRNEGEYLYTISSPEGIVRDLFSLFIHYDGIVVMNLPFRDQDNQRLTSLAGRGNDTRPSMRIKSREGQNIVPLYDIAVYDGRSVIIQTPREHLELSMYTQRDSLTGPVFPGSYYRYALKGYGGNRNQINAGPLTSSTPQKYSMPDPSGASTFGFDLTLDDTTLSISDGFQETVIDLYAIGSTIRTQPRVYEMDRPDTCETASLDIIKSRPTRKGVQGPSGERLMLVGKGRHTTDLRINHSGSDQMFVPHQLNQGHLRHGLDQSQFLTRGTNIYMIRLYDATGDEVCSRRIAVRY